MAVCTWPSISPFMRYSITRPRNNNKLTWHIPRCSLIVVTPSCPRRNSFQQITPHHKAYVIIRISLFMYVCMYKCAYMHRCICVCMCACMNEWMNECMYVLKCLTKKIKLKKTSAKKINDWKLLRKKIWLSHDGRKILVYIYIYIHTLSNTSNNWTVGTAALCNISTGLTLTGKYELKVEVTASSHIKYLFICIYMFVCLFVCLFVYSLWKVFRGKFICSDENVCVQQTYIQICCCCCCCCWNMN